MDAANGNTDSNTGHETDRIARRQRRLVRRAKAVSWAKIVLPLLGVAILGALLLTGRDRGGDLSDLFSAEEIARLGAGLTLENPRLAGVTADNQPYEFTATEARPDGPLAEVIDFSAPRGRIELPGREISGEAAEGVLDRNDGTLNLSGGVTLTTSDGWSGKTDAVTVNLDRRTAESSGAVEAEGPNGTLEAGSMRVEEAGPDAAAPTIVFENNVRVRFIPPPDG